VNEDSSLGYVALAFALAVGGGTLGAVLGTSHKRLCALISLGAGTLLGVTLFAILPETVAELQWWQLLLGLASGYFLFSIVSKYIFHVCPACAASHFDEATTHRFSEIASAMMLALAIHCTVDGLAMSAGGNESGGPSAAANRAVVFSIILAVCVHKIPEGLALGALLRGAGLHTSGIIWRVIAVEATTLLGGVIGWLFFPQASGFWVAAALANAGGGFIFLATHAVIGELIEHHKALVLSCFAGGVGLIGAFVVILHFWQ
jgi:zinc transporter ZupT